MSWLDNRDVIAALTGRTITSVEISPDKEKLTLQTDQGPITLVALGDCCSRSWFESLDDPGALLGTVTQVEEIPMPEGIFVEEPDAWSDDFLQFYGLKITTQRGRCVIEYRNSSNGYYGGYLEVAK